MASRESGFHVDLKSDGSPVTAADIAAERFIRSHLAGTMPGVPIIAEESFNASRGELAPDCFLLVDPLDGTREFISGRDEFTVNIALIEKGSPVVGAIFAPALNELSLAGTTAYRASVRPGEAVSESTALSKIATSSVPAAGMRAIGSRAHMDPTTECWLQQLPVVKLYSAGSSLKFCLVARGSADVYPRLAPTMEWDTAAGHAILLAAGGCVVGLDGAPLRYGKAECGFKNAEFVAWGRAPFH